MIPKIVQQEERKSPTSRRRILFILQFAILFLMMALSISNILLSEYQIRQDLDKGQQLTDRQQAMNKGTTTEITTKFTVDILSVGSINQLELLEAQKRTFDAHESVRNFFNITEIDDADPNCHVDMTIDHVRDVSNFCRRKRGKTRRGSLFNSMLGEYARFQWLEKKKNPMGWMCAQPRPYSGLMKVFNHFNMTGQSLPTYFVIMDDDTYYNMEWFQATMEAMNTTSMVAAGCLIRKPTNQINFTFPYGGYGTIVGGEVLAKMFQPLHCPSGFFDVGYGHLPFGLDQFIDICNRLKENNVEELQYFTNGMNLVELMYKYANTDMYKNVSQWKEEKVGDGFCMHSDWVLGYFINYYNVSSHVKDAYYRDVAHSRIEEFQGSELYGSRKKGFCSQDQKACEHGSKLCHRVSPQWLDEEFQSQWG